MKKILILASLSLSSLTLNAEVTNPNGVYNFNDFEYKIVNNCLVNNQFELKEAIYQSESENVNINLGLLNCMITALSRKDEAGLFIFEEALIALEKHFLSYNEIENDYFYDYNQEITTILKSLITYSNNSNGYSFPQTHNSIMHLLNLDKDNIAGYISDLNRLEIAELALESQNIQGLDVAYSIFETLSLQFQLNYDFPNEEEEITDLVFNILKNITQFEDNRVNDLITIFNNSTINYAEFLSFDQISELILLSYDENNLEKLDLMIDLLNKNPQPQVISEDSVSTNVGELYNKLANVENLNTKYTANLLLKKVSLNEYYREYVNTEELLKIMNSSLFATPDRFTATNTLGVLFGHVLNKSLDTHQQNSQYISEEIYFNLFVSMLTVNEIVSQDYTNSYINGLLNTMQPQVNETVKLRLINIANAVDNQYAASLFQTKL